MKPKNIVLLGCTGSIGVSTQKVAADLPGQIRIVGMASRENVDGMVEAIRQFKPLAVGMTNPEKAEELRKRLSASAKASADVGAPGGRALPVHSGEKGLIELATMPEADIVLVAIVGTAGLEPALAAIRAGKDLAVASKEILVMAGEIVMREAKKHKVKILPVDSEHNAIFQCIERCQPSEVRRVILTASGGPFRRHSHDDLH